MTMHTFQQQVKDWRFSRPTILVGGSEPSEEQSYFDELVLEFLDEEPGVYDRIISEFAESGVPHAELELDTGIDIFDAARLSAAVALGEYPVLVIYHPELERIELLLDYGTGW